MSLQLKLKKDNFYTTMQTENTSFQNKIIALFFFFFVKIYFLKFKGKKLKRIAIN